MSIIIPAYNTAPYIHRAIESSLRQTHKNVEVLVIDDGSTDDTLSIAEEYARRDERVRVFHQDNAGVSAARNCGIREAKGEYLMFLDSDDWFEDNAAEFLLDAQQKYPDKFAGGSWDEFFVYAGDDNMYTPRTKHGTDTGQAAIFTLEEAVCNFRVGFWTYIYRSELIRRHNIMFDEGMHNGEDQIFMIAYLCRTNGRVNLGHCVYNYFRHQDSISYKIQNGLCADPNEKDFYSLMLETTSTASPEVQRAMKALICKQMLRAAAESAKESKSTAVISRYQEKAKMYSKSCSLLRYRTIPLKVKICLLYITNLPAVAIKGLYLPCYAMRCIKRAVKIYLRPVFLRLKFRKLEQVPKL